MKLSVQERLGAEWNGYLTTKYRAKEGTKPPKYMERSIRLINRYDGHMGSEFATNEDMSVEQARYVVCWLIIALGGGVTGLLLLTGASTIMASTIVAVLICGLLVDTVFSMALQYPETPIDWLASRLFGAPARPRLYIKQGIARGLIEIDTR